MTTPESLCALYDIPLDKWEDVVAETRKIADMCSNCAPQTHHFCAIFKNALDDNVHQIKQALNIF